MADLVKNHAGINDDVNVPGWTANFLVLQVKKMALKGSVTVPVSCAIQVTISVKKGLSSIVGNLDLREILCCYYYE